ncbi:sugar transferase [Lentibacter sp. XHP0401]|jgi:lipopolysaccharide/colanic/teichoic acid biosynthesis glycosyltransferase|uniref:sugar transferase n=1 Tax=Lentibacter sp. XHP0401 TaxID=2984334 RepID=UPI0029822DE5|nr:sugar transferase [Lentibacter sp. XHP0401]
MSVSKRGMDLVLALLLAFFLWPLALVIAALIKLGDGGGVFYVAERMRGVNEPFQLWKFRTMSAAVANEGVSGGDKAGRITGIGRFLRRTRLDELPQLWNILRGDISFVGPRPPLRRYVEMFPALYGEVLKARPGVTGLATLAFHRREEALLAGCGTPEETEAVYVRRCVPVKARIDMIYARERSLCYDLQLMVATVFRRVPLRARKARD